jgi:NTP pyrophosphatase (non-canonical NTP hydrolase)
MRASEYQEETARTDLKNYLAVEHRLENVRLQRLIHYGMGMVTEAGEFIDMLKKHMMYGKPLDRTNLIEEIGDLAWYMARACDELCIDFEEVLRRNIEKLKTRYPEKFTEDKALNRDLEKEREVLQSL